MINGTRSFIFAKTIGHRMNLENGNAYPVCCVRVALPITKFYTTQQKPLRINVACVFVFCFWHCFPIATARPYELGVCSVQHFAFIRVFRSHSTTTSTLVRDFFSTSHSECAVNQHTHNQRVLLYLFSSINSINTFIIIS